MGRRMDWGRVLIAIGFGVMLLGNIALFVANQMVMNANKELAEEVGSLTNQLEVCQTGWPTPEGVN